MTHRFQLVLVALAASVITLLTARGFSPAVAQGEGFSDSQVKSIEQIVRDYLMKNPEVLVEASEALEKRKEAERAEAVKAKMPELYKGIEAMKAELAGFTVGNGDVTMIEFFDYNCGYCAKVLPDVMKLQQSDNKLKIVFMEMPILAQASIEASKVAVAAAKQGKYLDFHREMFAAGARGGKEAALKVAEKIGLNMEKVKADSASPETMAFLTKVQGLAKGFVDGTPTFVIGDNLLPGAASAEDLKEVITKTRAEGCKSCVTASNTTGVKEEKKS
jgi:protein-disulfide isomerase